MKNRLKSGHRNAARFKRELVKERVSNEWQKEIKFQGVTEFKE